MSLHVAMLSARAMPVFKQNVNNALLSRSLKRLLLYLVSELATKFRELLLRVLKEVIFICLEQRSFKDFSKLKYLYFLLFVGVSKYQCINKNFSMKYELRKYQIHQFVNWKPFRSRC